RPRSRPRPRPRPARLPRATAVRPRAAAAVVVVADGGDGGVVDAVARKTRRRSSFARICPPRQVTMRAWASVENAMRSLLWLTALASACGSANLTVHDEL